MISKKQLTRNYDTLFASDYTQAISDNLDHLLMQVNIFMKDYKFGVEVTSGWRPAAVNASTKGAAPKSNHMVGLAMDLLDADGNLMSYVLAHLQEATELGLYFEDFRWTKNWVHIQTCSPKSKNRIYKPSEALPPCPQKWNGKYDSKFNK